MNEYAFDCTLQAAIRVKAKDEQDARAMLNLYIDANTANLGAWPNGDPILAEVSLINDDAPVLQHPTLYEVNGEPMD